MAKKRGTTHFIHDIFGNPARGLPSGRVTPETNGALGTPNTVKEYIWLPETQIAPTYYLHASGMTGSRTVVDRPLAVVNAVNTATPVMWWVSVDHLHRPIKMTDAAKAAVWTAVWTPWGTPHSLTGTATLDARFPGQWYQARGCGWASEAQSKTAGLHYNWHRSYDPSLGRYTQPDPLGFVDGPSVFGYAIANPQRFVDRDGLAANDPPNPSVPPNGGDNACPVEKKDDCKYAGEKYFGGPCKTCIYKCRWPSPVTFPQKQGSQCMDITSEGLVDTSQIDPICK